MILKVGLFVMEKTNQTGTQVLKNDAGKEIRYEEKYAHRVNRI